MEENFTPLLPESASELSKLIHIIYYLRVIFKQNPPIWQDWIFDYAAFPVCRGEFECSPYIFRVLVFVPIPFFVLLIVTELAWANLGKEKNLA